MDKREEADDRRLRKALKQGARQAAVRRREADREEQQRIDEAMART